MSSLRGFVATVISIGLLFPKGPQSAVREQPLAVRKKLRTHNLLAATKPNLIFVKTPKVGGSTFGGIVRRIGVRFNFLHATEALSVESLGREAPQGPYVWAQHAKRTELELVTGPRGGRNFYMTLVRDPGERCLSEYYFFQVGRKGVSPDSVPEKLNYISTQCASVLTNWTTHALHNVGASEILDAYDFVAIAERFDESLLVLAKILQLSVADVLYLKSKVTGSSTQDPFMEKSVRVHRPRLDEEPEAVRLALEKLKNIELEPDAELVRLANIKLDRFVETIGRQNLQKQLATFQGMLKTVEASCKKRFFESCLYLDNGCGQTCIDEAVTMYGWEPKAEKEKLSLQNWPLPRCTPSKIAQLTKLWSVKREHLRYLKSNVTLAKNAVFVEIGANEGKNAKFFLETHPLVDYYLYEPVPSFHKVLAARLAKYPHVHTANVGISRTNEAMCFATAEGVGAAGANTGDSDCGPGQEKGQMTTPELLFRNFDRIDFMQINCEGCEYVVLPAIVSTPSVVNILHIVEVHFHYYSKHWLDYCQVMEQMSEFFDVVYNTFTWVRFERQQIT